MDKKKAPAKDRSSKGKQEEKREYTDTLDSLLKLKHGNDKRYSEIVMKAMEATDNLINLKKSQGG